MLSLVVVWFLAVSGGADVTITEKFPKLSRRETDGKGPLVEEVSTATPR
jgi:hypothetical protein